ncbi:MAG: type II toxin-antitoxin system VapC family toxin [Anaerolineales bacterium]
MSDQIFIDTAFVLALINARDKYHAQAIQLAEQYEAHPLIVTDAVLLEIGNALARSHKPQAVEVIERFLAAEEVEVVHLSPTLFRKAFSMYRKYQDKEWGLVDCVSFVVMHEFEIRQALTFDQHFTQAGFGALMQVTNSRQE